MTKSLFKDIVKVLLDQNKQIRRNGVIVSYLALALKPFKLKPIDQARKSKGLNKRHNPINKGNGNVYISQGTRYGQLVDTIRGFRNINLKQSKGNFTVGLR